MESPTEDVHLFPRDLQREDIYFPEGNAHLALKNLPYSAILP